MFQSTLPVAVERCAAGLMRCEALLDVTVAARLVFQAPDLTEAKRRLAEYLARFAKTAPKAVACLEAGFEETIWSSWRCR